MAPQSAVARAIAHLDNLIDAAQPSSYLVDGFKSIAEPQDYRLKRCLNKREPLSDENDPEDHVIQKNALIAFVALDFYAQIPIHGSKEHMAAIAVDLGWRSSEHLRRIIDHYAGERLAYLGKVESRYIPVSASNLARKLCHFVDQYRLCRAKPEPMTDSHKKEFNKMRLVWQKAYRETPRALLEANLELPAVLSRHVQEDQPRSEKGCPAASGIGSTDIPASTGFATSEADQGPLPQSDLASVPENNHEALRDGRSSPSPRSRSRSPIRSPPPFHIPPSHLIEDAAMPQVTSNVPVTMMYDSYRPTPDFVHPSRRALMEQRRRPTAKAKKRGQGHQHWPPLDLVHPSRRDMLRPRANSQQQENRHVAPQSALEIKQEPMPEVKQEPHSDEDAYTTGIPKHIAGRNGEPTRSQLFYSAEMDSVRADQEAAMAQLARFERRAAGYEAVKGLPPVILQSMKRLVDEQKKVRQELKYLHDRIAAQR